MSEQPVIVTDGDYFSVAEDERTVCQGVNHQRHPATPGPMPRPPVTPRRGPSPMPQWKVAKRVQVSP